MATHERQFTEEEFKILYELAALKMPLDQIAQVMRMHEQTLQRMMKNDERVHDTIVRGRNDTSRQVRATLYQMAVGKKQRMPEKDRNGKIIMPAQKAVDADFQALRFWCETQEGFKRSESLDVKMNFGEGPLSEEEREKRTDKILDRLAAHRARRKA